MPRKALPPLDEQKRYSVTEASRYLHVSTAAIYQWTKARKILTVKEEADGLTFIPGSEIARVLAERSKGKRAKPKPKPKPRAQKRKPRAVQRTTASGPFKIEHGIPIPSVGGPNSDLRIALRQLKPTDSVLIPRSMRSATRTAAKDILGKGKYITRTLGKNIRLWRLK